MLLSALLYLEAAGLGALTASLVVEIFSVRPDSYLSAVALIVLALLATVWLAIMATHTLQGRPWIRGGAVTWQVLQLIIGVTMIAGGSALGWPLVVIAAIVLVVLFTRPVIAATRRELRQD